MTNLNTSDISFAVTKLAMPKLAEKLPNLNLVEGEEVYSLTLYSLSDGLLALHADLGQTIYGASEGDVLYPILEAMLGRTTAWEDADEVIRAEWENEDGSFVFNERKGCSSELLIDTKLESITLWDNSIVVP